jgi:hypothetical protein
MSHSCFQAQPAGVRFRQHQPRWKKHLTECGMLRSGCYLDGKEPRAFAPAALLDQRDLQVPNTINPMAARSNEAGSGVAATGSGSSSDWRRIVVCIPLELVNVITFWSAPVSVSPILSGLSGCRGTPAVSLVSPTVICGRFWNGTVMVNRSLTIV